MKNLQITIKCQGKKAKITERDIGFCWTCGHHSKMVYNRCGCCYLQVSKPKKGEKYLEIKRELDTILKNQTEPEFRFYIDGWVCWIRQKDLDEYKKLSEVEKSDRYFHFIKSLIEYDKIARVIH